MHKNSIFFLLILISLFSCKKKEENYSLNGKVSDIITGSPISGVTLEVQGKVISSSTYSSMFSTFATGTSGSDGYYALDFEKEKVTVFKLIARKNGYLLYEIEFSPDLLSSGSYTLDVLLANNGWISVRVVNALPSFANDEFSYRFLNIPVDIASSCGSGYNSFSGIVDQQVEACFVPGGMNLVIEKNYNHEQTHIQTFDTLYIIPNDTLEYIIQY
jgi:molybdopterin-binding protein